MANDISSKPLRGPRKWTTTVEVNMVKAEKALKAVEPDTSGWLQFQRFLLQYIWDTHSLFHRIACQACRLVQYQCHVNLSQEAAIKQTITQSVNLYIMSEFPRRDSASLAEDLKKDILNTKIYNTSPLPFSSHKVSKLILSWVRINVQLFKYLNCQFRIPEWFFNTRHRRVRMGSRLFLK